jgi:hypothetical protein
MHKQRERQDRQRQRQRDRGGAKEGVWRAGPSSSWACRPSPGTSRPRSSPERGGAPQPGLEQCRAPLRGCYTLCVFMCGACTELVRRIVFYRTSALKSSMAWRVASDQRAAALSSRGDKWPSSGRLVVLSGDPWVPLLAGMNPQSAVARHPFRLQALAWRVVWSLCGASCSIR